MKDKLPLSARLVILAVAMEGLAIVILRILQVGRWNAHDAIAWAALMAGIVVAEQFTIPIRFRTETLNFSVTEGVWIAALILSRSSVLTLAVAAGILAGNTLRRWAPYKAAFNVGQFVLAVSVAQIVYGSFGASGALHPRTWLATGAAMAAYAVVNATLVALIISLVEGKSLRAVLVAPMGANALHFAGNTVIGLAGAMLWSATPFAFPVVVLPLVAAFVVYRFLAATVRQRAEVGTVGA
jgi:hypothetical protein